MPVQFTTHTAEPGITVVELTGRLTLGNRLAEVERAVKELIEKGSRGLELDLAPLTFMDSAGIGMMMMLACTIKDAHGRLFVAGA